MTISLDFDNGVARPGGSARHASYLHAPRSAVQSHTPDLSYTVGVSAKRIADDSRWGDGSNETIVGAGTRSTEVSTGSSVRNSRSAI